MTSLLTNEAHTVHRWPWFRVGLSLGPGAGKQGGQVLSQCTSAIVHKLKSKQYRAKIQEAEQES